MPGIWLQWRLLNRRLFMGAFQVDQSLIDCLSNLVHGSGQGTKMSHYAGKRRSKLGIHRGRIGFPRLS